MKILFWTCLSLMLAGAWCQQELTVGEPMTTISPEDPRRNCNVEVCFMLEFTIKNTGNREMSYSARCRITDNEGHIAYQEDKTCTFRVKPGEERDVKLQCKLNVPAVELKTYNIETTAIIQKFFSGPKQTLLEKTYDTSFTVDKEKGVEEPECPPGGGDPDQPQGPGELPPGGIGGNCGIFGPSLMPGNTEGAFNYTGVLRWFNPTEEWQLIPYKYRASNSLNEIYEETEFVVPPRCAGTINIERPFNVRSILNRKFDINGWWAGCWPPLISSKIDKFSHTVGVYPEP